MNIDEIINTTIYNLNDEKWQVRCRKKLSENGVLKLDNFLTKKTLNSIINDSENGLKYAYFKPQSHNVYLRPKDPSFSDEHPRNYLVRSSKGCITDDQISNNSLLKKLYNSSEFKMFLKFVLEEESLYAM